MSDPSSSTTSSRRRYCSAPNSLVDRLHTYLRVRRGVNTSTSVPVEYISIFPSNNRRCWDNWTRPANLSQVPNPICRSADYNCAQGMSVAQREVRARCNCVIHRSPVPRYCRSRQSQPWAVASPYIRDYNGAHSPLCTETTSRTASAHRS